MSATIPSGTELRRAALKRVEGYVCKDRQATHGDAEDNFRQIAAYWALYKGYPFTPGDVAAMMALVKIARMKTSPDYVDNWDDLAGYAICGAGLADKKRMSEPPKEPVPTYNGLSRAECPQCHHKIFFDLTPHWHTPPDEVIETCPKCDTKFRPLVPPKKLQVESTEVSHDVWTCSNCLTRYPIEVAPWIRDSTSTFPRVVCVKCGDPNSQ